MLEMNNSYVRLFVTINEHLQSGLLPVCHAVWSCSRTVSGTVNIAVDTRNLPSTNKKATSVAILILVESRAVQSIIIQSRTIDCHTAPVCRTYWKCIAAGTGNPLHCGFCLHIPEDSKARRSWSPLRILLLATDAARRYECRAAWWPAVPAVSYQCLHENRTAATKLSAV